MPIFEYKCRACGNEFEAIVMPWVKSASECPSCRSEDLEQLLSAFAVNSQERSQATWNAAQKKFEQTTLRDKKVAERESIEHHLNDHH